MLCVGLAVCGVGSACTVGGLGCWFLIQVCWFSVLVASVGLAIWGVGSVCRFSGLKHGFCVSVWGVGSVCRFGDVGVLVPCVGLAAHQASTLI